MNELGAPSLLQPIAIASLQPDSPLEFDLYLRVEPQQPPVLYRERHCPLDAAEFRSLRENGVETLYIAEHAAAAYEQYVRTWTLSSRAIPAADRFRIVSQISRAGFLQALQSDCPDRMVENAVQLGEQIVDTIVDDDLLLSDLFRVMQHDYCTFTHVSNVCAYCLTLATALGITARASLTAIAAGALLHDIGKRKTPAAILNKPGKLTSSEREIVERHPRDGFEELRGRSDLQWGQLMMTYQHHERPDGRGYPVGVEQDELHPWAQICSVADVFEALTGERPYRTPMPLDQALGFLQQRSGTQFNAEFVQCWVQSMTRKH